MTSDSFKPPYFIFILETNTFISYVPYLAKIVPSLRTPSLAEFIYGNITVKISSSPIPLSTKGSAPKTRALEEIVSVSVIATFFLFIPAPQKLPSFWTTFGMQVYCIGLFGRSISNFELTDL